MTTNDKLGSLPQVRISIGEVRSSATPSVLKTLLGSCVAVCLYDPECGRGGINHISLPGNSSKPDARFAVHAMELLINELMNLGCNRKRLVAKAFGGANILGCIRVPVGSKNADFVTGFLAEEQIPLLAHRLGGVAALEVHFRTDTGYVLLRTLNRSQQVQVERGEAAMGKATHHPAAAIAAESSILLF